MQKIHANLSPTGANRCNTAQYRAISACAKNITVPEHLNVSTFAQTEKRAKKNTLPNRIYTIFGAKKKKIVKFSARLAHDLLLLHTKCSFFVNKQKHVAVCAKNVSLCAKCAKFNPQFSKKKKKKLKKKIKPYC